MIIGKIKARSMEGKGERKGRKEGGNDGIVKKEKLKKIQNSRLKEKHREKRKKRKKGN